MGSKQDRVDLTVATDGDADRSPDGSVWVVDSHRQTLIELDPATDSVVRQLSIASVGGQRSLDSLAVLDDSLWVVDLSGSLLRVEIP